MRTLRAARTDIPAGATLARQAFERWDYTDSYAVELPPGATTEPWEWARKIFFGKPFPERDRNGRECLTGESVTVLGSVALDFLASVLVLDGTVTVTTVVRYRTRAGRWYFTVVRPFHRRLVPWMVARAARRVRAGAR
ncbi:DUF2867 domain-containing protein [Nocardia sp. NPDC050710]|uniref:DUF2867 domain-containing protein n=1 Tax=Nocardia sp. NPDC050710 TaxID=3157220 RepID=UPI003405581E